MSSVRKTLLLYRQERGEFPPTLESLVARGYMTAIRLPDGFALRYNAASGDVAVLAPPLFARALVTP